ncbi:hypothetical protein P168DRAFT_299936 [Aspergillus campestris IBT 28561]|uniref:NADP-dependent oxidoreductase domain-containing protein n=1 Tax=Aspergillus campestris (strain IBT 28561) TaxID=1392248 RepID=A0A2I1CSE5_ASPC2|nr:uncharacterized protein P168DRAFT_299936 [Aspergillus campestris IBT 28561]PKY00545.1 hypothetical protein P168DRAFT_299936 [Aspergillus campestris IBT 28561]
MGSIIGYDEAAKRTELNPNILSEIPLFNRPLTLTNHGSSAWAHSYRIDLEVEDRTESYFMKVSVGYHGREALKGEFESTCAMHDVVGEFTTKPVGWGSFKSLAGAHYYFCQFHDLIEEVPEPGEFCKGVAALHANSQSPNGKFGFHIVTYNGDLPQNNDYADTWEEFFIHGFENMIQLNIDRGGPWKELEGLDTAMITKVIPRLLRPMETDGRYIKPSLVHGDLWCGNAAVDGATNQPLIYDPASFYAHNEYELGNWRPERNKFSKSYFNTYHSHIPKTYPEEDYDDRNALYSMRFNLQAAALFPHVASLRESVIDEMKRLVEKYPGGRGGADNNQVKETVLKALKCGYRHIDTATAYGNEKEVGEAIKESGVPREEVFVTTKLAQTWHEPADVERALDTSLELLQLDYVDLYLMHFPHAYRAGPNNSTIRHPDGKPVIDYALSRDYCSTWTAMEALVDKGKTRLIGVSNFSILKLRKLLTKARIPPAVNQVEAHPYLPQTALLTFCTNHGIHITAHQPLGGKPVAAVNPNADRPGPLYDPDITAIATKYNLSPAQVLLSWLLQRGISVIPKTVHESRLVENMELRRMNEEDMEAITGLAERKGEVRYLDPKGHVGFDIFDEEVDEPVEG